MKGKEIIPCEHDRIYACSEGMFLYAKLKENGWEKMYGFLDKKGNVVINAEYDNAEHFHDGLALVAKEDEERTWINNYAFINKNGEIVIDFKTYKEMKSFSHGLAAVKVEKDNKSLWGYINTKGEMLIAPTYGYAYSFSDNVAIVGKGDKVFVIDNKGEIVFIPGKDMLLIEEEFSDGLIAVAKGNGLSRKCGFINTKGEEAIPMVYDYAENFINGEAAVIKDKKLMIIDKKGNVIEERTIDAEEIEEYLEDLEDLFDLF